jgi:hypothetical protein
MTRSVLTIVQDAATKLGIAQPSVLFGSTDRTAIELREALNEAVDKILHAHDWQRLLTLQTYIGDGTTTQFSIPADYLRMPKSAEVWSSRLQAPLAHISPEDWLQLDTRDYDVATGVWTIFGGEFVFKPAPASGETTRFWYITNKVCTNDTSGTKAQFTEDDDTFLLDDRVLELVLVWLFRTQKGLDYAEDMATAEIALARMIERDKGARVITQRSRRSVGAKIAWPGVLSP